jgi:guanosine-3',5'-bis(diphosphate) 3'-pyrophosphohydrolase
MSNSYSVVSAARLFALQAHREQTYPPNGDPPFLPFHAHLGHVIGALHRFGWGDAPDVVAAGWLHDVMEDTPATLAEVRFAVGEYVAGIAYLVTDPPGANRRERKAKLYEQILAETHSMLQRHAIAVKLADRIANVEWSRATTPRDGINASSRFYRMYQDEYPAFGAALSRISIDADDRFAAMWKHLDTLLFPRA